MRYHTSRPRASIRRCRGKRQAGKTLTSLLSLVLVAFLSVCFSAAPAAGSGKPADTATTAPGISLFEQYVADHTAASEDGLSAADAASLINDNGLAILADPAFESEFVFEEGSTTNVSAAALTEEKFVVAYSDAGDANKGKARIGEVKGYNMAFGSEYTFASVMTDTITAVALAKDRFAVVFENVKPDPLLPADGCVAIGNVEGNVITFGPYEIIALSASCSSATALTESRIAIAYRDGYYSEGNGYVRVFDITGEDVTQVASDVFNVGAIYRTSITALTKGKFRYSL